ncbi:hypothetical protein Gotri_008134 [Gossypium trilobum]|uniref:Uncharacterized protein n=1 Tax=Gossypium trilobum TaxID=34281 RepID=A0A7J9EID5_9ROSI|nr:hypothetical protein [Gossypium trilobum]
MKRLAIELMEIQEEKIKADQWEKKFQDARAREVTLEKSLLECQNKKMGLKARVTDLENSLHQHFSHNSAIELNASLGKIEELKEQSQDQIRERDYIMGEAVAQVRKVTDHLQTLAVQADVLSLKYESESDRGRELAWLIRKVKALSIRENLYM